jgi:hypothetical protein
MEGAYMAMGKCRHCGGEPVAADAEECPQCGTNDPNPSTRLRFIRFCLFCGLILGGLNVAVRAVLAGLPVVGVVVVIVGYFGLALIVHLVWVCRSTNP